GAADRNQRRPPHTGGLAGVRIRTGPRGSAADRERSRSLIAPVTAAVDEIHSGMAPAIQSQGHQSKSPERDKSEYPEQQNPFGHGEAVLGKYQIRPRKRCATETDGGSGTFANEAPVNHPSPPGDTVGNGRQGELDSESHADCQGE